VEVEASRGKGLLVMERSSNGKVALYLVLGLLTFLGIFVYLFPLVRWDQADRVCQGVSDEQRDRSEVRSGSSISWEWFPDPHYVCRTSAAGSPYDLSFWSLEPVLSR